MKVPWRLKASPILLKQTVPEAADIRSGHDQSTSAFENPTALTNRLERVRNVLNDMVQGNGVEALCRKRLLLQRTACDIEALLIGRLNRPWVKIDSFHSPPQPLHLLDPFPGTAPDVQ